MTVEIQVDANYLSFVKTAQFIYQEMPDYQGDSRSLVLTLDMVKRHNFTPQGDEKSVYENILIFCKAVFGESFNQDHPVCSNLAQVTFEGDSLNYFNRPVLARMDGDICLVMGSQNKDSGLEYVTLPLVLRDNNFTFQGSLLPKVSLSSYEISSKGDVEKVKIPILTFKASGQVFVIAVKLSKEYDYYDLQNAWEDRDLETMTKMIGTLYGGSANLGKMFSRLFISGKFPQEGVIMKITGGKLRRVDSGKKQFSSVVYTLDSSCVSPVTVLAYADGADTQVPLSSVSHISCYSSHTASVPFFAGKDATPASPWYIHVSAPNKNGDPNQVPIHQIFTDFIPPRIRKLITALGDDVNPTSRDSEDESRDEMNFDDMPF